jgi:antirestriction protein ArdC
MQNIAYQVITDRLITMLEAGTAPWQKPWAGGTSAFPKNIKSKKPYSGINVWMLHMSGHSSAYFLTFKQAQELGGSVRKGEKGFPVVFTKQLPPRAVDVPTDNGGTERMIDARTGGRMLKYYTVFNVEQCDGITAPDAAAVPTFDHDPIDTAERIISDMPDRPTITHAGGRACYSPTSDTITMPEAARFETRPAYYGTLFHELAHSTGHAARLNRKEVTSPTGYGSTPYGKEELVAEMAAAYICGAAGIERDILDNSAAYLAAWIETLKGDVKLAVQAASAAQKAADFILGRHAVTAQPLPTTAPAVIQAAQEIDLFQFSQVA